MVSAAKEESEGGKEFGFLNAKFLKETYMPCSIFPLRGEVFLISNFRRVLNLNVCILLGISPASD